MAAQTAQAAQTAPLGAPIEAFVRLIRGRHKSDIVISLGQRKALRFAELSRALPQMSQRVLARQLDALERDGVVRRTVVPGHGRHVEYALTDFGKTICPILKQIWKWSVQRGSAGGH